MASGGNVIPIFAKTIRTASHCAKKVLLDELLPYDRRPALSSGVGVRMAEAGQLRSLAEMWEEFSAAGSRRGGFQAGRSDDGGASSIVAHKIKAGDFSACVEDTIEKIRAFRTDHLAKLGPSAPPLVLFGAAVSVFVAEGGSGGGRRFDLRTRIDLLRYNPRRDWWTVRKVKTSTDPHSPAARRTALYEELLIDGFLVENLHRTAAAASTSSVSLPQLRVANVGVVHPWPHFPGPISLQDHDMKRLAMLFRTVWAGELRVAGCDVLPGGASTSSVDLLGAPAGKLDSLRTGRAAARGSGSDTSSGTSSREVNVLGSALTVSPFFTEAPAMVVSAIETVKAAHGGDGARPFKVHLFDKALRDVLPGQLVDHGAPGTGHPSQLDVKPFCTAPNECPYYSAGACLPRPLAVPTAAGSTAPKATVAAAGGDEFLTATPLKMATKAELWQSKVRMVSELTPQLIADCVPGKTALFMRAVRERRIMVNRAAVNRWVAAVKYPAFFLDFEAGSFCIPPFTRVTPYAPVPFQYSLHVFQTDVLTEKPVVHNYIHFGGRAGALEDPRPALLRALMTAIRAEREKKRIALADLAPPRSDSNGSRKGKAAKGKEKKRENPTKGRKAASLSLDCSGCIVAHSKSYEQRCLTKMATLEPAFKKEIKDFEYLDTIDLMRNVVHPQARGSVSMKALLPAFLPTLRYNDLGDGIAANGDNAAALYRLWIGDLLNGGYVPPKTEAERLTQAMASKAKTDAVRAALLEYCEKDTQGMWELVRVAHRLANDQKFARDNNVEFFI